LHASQIKRLGQPFKPPKFGRSFMLHPPLSTNMFPTVFAFSIYRQITFKSCGNINTST